MARTRECIRTGCPTWPPLQLHDDRKHFDKLDLFVCREHRQDVFQSFFGNGLRVHFRDQPDGNVQALFREGGAFARHKIGEEDCQACRENGPESGLCGERGCIGRVHHEWSVALEERRPNWLMRRCDQCGADHERTDRR